MATRSLRELHGATIHEGPSRPTVLLVHGFGCDQTMWRHLIPHFAGEYRVVTYDQAGAGRSDPALYDPQRHADLEGYADDMVALCTELGLEEVVVVGHSVAAMIGLLAHLRAPELVIGLAMISPSPRYVDEASYVGGFSREQIEDLLRSMAEDYETWVRAMVPTFLGSEDRPELVEELVESFRRTRPEVAEAFARATFLSDNRSRLTAVQCPTLVVQATADPFVPDSVGEYVHDRIDGSAFAAVDASGHFAPVTEPEKTAAPILAFLRPIRSFLERTRR